MAAGITHSMSPERLAQVSVSVPKVLILSAAEDIVIPAAEGANLKRHMPEAEFLGRRQDMLYAPSTGSGATNCWKMCSSKERKRLESMLAPL
ncbi:hypothetical protein L210DRAFT_3545759, partial [Boletus edulis BED1]